jgi:tetratricopeptide (TPR) repeat protein
MSDLIARGQLLRRQGRHTDAEACLRQAIAAEPDDVRAHAELAQCLLEQEGRRTDALAAIDRAISLDPGLAYLHARRADILSRLGRDREAIETADRAIAIDPDDSHHFAVKAQALTGLERYAEAETLCRQALALDADDCFATNLLAHLLRIQGKIEESQVAADKLLADDPEDPYAHYNAGWTALQRNNHRLAETHFREALRLDAGFEPAREGLLVSFRGRSALYRGYLRWCFWMQQFTSKARWVIIVGFLLLYNFGSKLLGMIHPLAGLAVVVAYLSFALWTWLAPGLGNLLLLKDRSARFALRRPEILQGLVSGGGFVVGALILAVSAALSYPPGYLIGGALALGAIPARLFFGNESRQGRLVFGSLLAFLYVAGFGCGVLEMLRHPAEGFAYLTSQAITGGVIAAVACTWLGSLDGLTEERPR